MDHVVQLHTIFVLNLPHHFDFLQEKFLEKVLQGGLLADDLDRNFLVELHRTSRFHFRIKMTSQGFSKNVTVLVEAVLRRLFQA